MPRQIIIGDVHSCQSELKELIRKLQLAADDHLVFVGDLINKGPDSAGVLNLVHWIGRNVCACDSVMGNHEEKFIRYVGHREQFKVFNNAIGIDLGCVYGHFLGALVFDANRPGHQALVVKAKSVSVS